MRLSCVQVEAFPLYGGFLLPPGDGDPAAAEQPEPQESLLPAVTPASGDAAAALTALARQVRE